MSERRRMAVGAAALFALNAWICRELFTLEYSRHMGSIEAAYISLARYIAEHPFEWGWFPLWYGGVPFQNTYPPVLHQLTGLAAGLSGASPALAYHFVCAVLYCLGPVTLYWLALRLSGRFWPAWFAGLAHSLLSPSAWLLAGVAGDIGGPLNARRFQTLVFYGEGPHVAALTLLPAAIVALDWALRRGSPVRVYLAAAALAAVVLTNWLGAVGLAMAALAYLLAREDRRRWTPWLKAAGVAGLAYLLAATWIPPSTLADVRRNAQLVGGPYPLELGNILYALLAVAVLLLLDRLLLRFEASRAVRFGGYYSLLVGAPVLIRETVGAAIVPQPERYHLEMEQGLCLLLAFGGAALVARGGPIAGRVALAAAVLFLVYEAAIVRPYARDLNGSIDVRQTAEYRLAKQVAALGPDARVWAEGSAGFWLNAFAPNAQFHGGFDQGITNTLIPAITFGMQDNRNAGDQARLWMQSYGVDAVAVGGLDSKLARASVQDERKFESHFERAWTDGDLTVWRTPRRSRSLARVLFASERVERTPEHALDVGPLIGFVAAIEDPGRPLPETEWVSPDRMRITANLEPDHWVLAQISYHHGWSATVEGPTVDGPTSNGPTSIDTAVPIEKSLLGLMLIEPRCDGPCTIELRYDGGPEMWAARAALWPALGGGLVWIWVRRRDGKERADA